MGRMSLSKVRHAKSHMASKPVNIHNSLQS